MLKDEKPKSDYICNSQDAEDNILCFKE